MDERIHVLCTNEAINGKEFAEAIGISPQYLTDFRTGRVSVKNPRNFWKGVRTAFPRWEGYLRGETDTPPTGKQIVAKSDLVDGHPPPPSPQSIELSDYLSKTSDVLKHPSIYSTALRSNIEAFHDAITTREELNNLRVKVDQHEQRFKEQDELLKELRDRLSAVKVGSS